MAPTRSVSSICFCSMAMMYAPVPFFFGLQLAADLAALLEASAVAETLCRLERSVMGDGWHEKGMAYGP